MTYAHALKGIEGIAEDAHMTFNGQFLRFKFYKSQVNFLPEDDIAIFYLDDVKVPQFKDITKMLQM